MSGKALHGSSVWLSSESTQVSKRNGFYSCRVCISSQRSADVPWLSKVQRHQQMKRTGAVGVRCTQHVMCAYLWHVSVDVPQRWMEWPHHPFFNRRQRWGRGNGSLKCISSRSQTTLSSKRCTFALDYTVLNFKKKLSEPGWSHLKCSRRETAAVFVVKL